MSSTGPSSSNNEPANIATSPARSSSAKERHGKSMPPRRERTLQPATAPALEMLAEDKQSKPAKDKEKGREKEKAREKERDKARDAGTRARPRSSPGEGGAEVTRSCTAPLATAPSKSTPPPPAPTLPLTPEARLTPSIMLLHDDTADANTLPPRPRTPLTPPHTPARHRSTPAPSPRHAGEEVPAPRFSAFEEKLTRSLQESALPKSLARFIQKLTIYDEESVVWRASDHAHKSLLAQVTSALHSLQSLLDADVDLRALSECKGDPELAVTVFVDTLADETVFATVLKATFSQSIVAPLWLWLKLSLLHEFPFKDVPLGWRVDLVHSLHSVIVTHHKLERARLSVSAADVPAFTFQWNLQISIDKLSGKMENYRFWISDVAVESAPHFDAAQAARLRAVVNPWCAERDLSLTLDAPQLTHRDAAHVAEAEAQQREAEDAGCVYRGWVRYKTGKSYEVCWMSFRESTTLVSIFTNDPQQDPVSSRVVAVLDLRRATLRERSDAKRLLLEVATANKKLHKFKFDDEASKALFAETVAECVAYAEQMEARLDYIRQRLVASDELAKTERLYHSASPSTRPATVELTSTTAPKPAKSKSRRTSAEARHSSAIAAESAERVSEAPVRTAKSLKETQSAARAELVALVPTSHSIDATALERSPNDKKHAPLPLLRTSHRKRSLAAAQSSAADLAKYLRFRAQMKAAAQQLLDFPIANVADRKTSLRALCHRRSAVAYVLRDYGDLAAQFAVETLLKRDKGFLLHRGMNIVLIGAGAPKLLHDASSIPTLLSEECVYTDHSSHLIARLFAAHRGSDLVGGELCAGVFLISAAQGVVYSAPISLHINLPPSETFVHEINRFIHENPRMNWSQLSAPLISWNDLQQDSADAMRMIEAPRTLFTCEFGTRVPYQPPLKIEEEVHFYEETIAKIAHSHFATIVPGFGPLVLTIEDDVAEPRALIWSKRGISNHVVPAAVAAGKKAVVMAHLVEKVIAGAHDRVKHPDLLDARLAFKRIKRREFNARLIALHSTIASNHFKIGVLLAPEGCCTEDAIYAVDQREAELDADLKEFLEMLAERVVLKDWPRFRGGLDVKNNLTGEVSYYTQIDECEIMFHVAPLIPQQGAADPSKKRYVGNDIVVIVFKKGAQDRFYPADMSSQFNHIYVVVEKIRDVGGAPKYRVNIANKASVPPYPPYLESPPVFSAGAEFRRYLLTKLINGERAAISKAKMFSTGNAKTLENLLLEAIKEATS